MPRLILWNQNKNIHLIEKNAGICLQGFKQMQTVVIHCIARGDENVLKINYFRGLSKAPDSVKAGFLAGLFVSSLARDLPGKRSPWRGG